MNNLSSSNRVPINSIIISKDLEFLLSTLRYLSSVACSNYYLTFILLKNLQLSLKDIMYSFICSAQNISYLPNFTAVFTGSGINIHLLSAFIKNLDEKYILLKLA